MRCPRCSKPVDELAETCYACHYSIKEAEAFFGSNLVQMDRLHDVAHCLRKRDRDDVEDILDQMEGRFPQLCFFTYLGDLQSQIRLHELGFWLLNHVAVRGADFSRPNENAVLVLLDVNSRQVGITLGYFAEQLLDEQSLHACLQAARPHFINGDFGLGLCLVFKKLCKALSRKAREMKRESPRRRSPGHGPEDPGKVSRAALPSPSPHPLLAGLTPIYSGRVSPLS